MKQTIVLNSWKIKQCGSLAQPGQEDTPVLVKKYAGEWIEIGGIMEVQEALIQKGLLSGSIIEDADAEYCQWINENDWAYQCTFREHGGGYLFKRHFSRNRKHHVQKLPV